MRKSKPVVFVAWVTFFAALGITFALRQSPSATGNAVEIGYIESAYAAAQKCSCLPKPCTTGTAKACHVECLSTETATCSCGATCEHGTGRLVGENTCTCQ